MIAFKTGDVVRLRSGGPKMTITEPPEAGITGYHCVWFDEQNVYHSHYFGAEALMMYGIPDHTPSIPGHFDTIA